ncbi:MAG: hypothetical protein QXV17_01560 [Candidatus Micrarchaeaceae archaeon]
MKCSFEMPIPMLLDGDSRKYNDYEYALVSLFDKFPSYYQYYLTQLHAGSEIFFDISNYTLFDTDIFVEWLINNANSNTNIVTILPNVINNLQDSISQANLFLTKYKNLPGRKMAVLQGQTIDDLLHCYDAYKTLNVDLYGIPAMIKPFYNSNPINIMANRQQFIITLIAHDNNIQKKSIHLMECVLPQEFRYYVDTNLDSYIYSLNTANPIINGINKIRYTKFGLRKKVSSNFEDVITLLDGVNDAIYNIQMFRRINNLKSNKNNLIKGMI